MGIALIQGPAERPWFHKECHFSNANDKTVSHVLSILETIKRDHKKVEGLVFAMGGKVTWSAWLQNLCGHFIGP